MRVVKARKPKGYRKLNIYFKNISLADNYVNSIRKEFLLKKASLLEHPDLNKRKRKLLSFSRPKKYLLTLVGSEYCLWEEL